MPLLLLLYFCKSSSFFDDGDHALAQLQKHLRLIRSQLIVVRKLMNDCFIGGRCSTGEIIQRHFQNLCKALRQVFLGRTGAFLVLRHTNVCGLFREACSLAQEFEGQAAKTN